MTNLLLLIDQTSLQNPSLSKAHLLELKSIFPNLKYCICLALNDLRKNLQHYADTYLAKQTSKRLIIFGNQQTLLLANQCYKDTIPFGYIWNHYSFPEVVNQIKIITQKTKPDFKNFIYYNEQVTDHEGLCSTIKFGKKAQISFKSKVKSLQNYKLKKSLHKLLKDIPNLYTSFPLDIYTKGQFINIRHIVSGQISLIEQNIQINLSNNYFQDLSWRKFNNKYKFTDTKLRLLITHPTTLTFDQLILPTQPFDLLVELKTINTWN